MSNFALSSSWRVAVLAALGILALWGALLAPLPTAGAQPTVPAEPVNVTATPGDSQVTLAWTPGDDNGSTIIRYEYTFDENGVAVNVWYPVPNSNRHTTGYTVTGLTNGHTYLFRLRAVNYEGNGAVATATRLPAVPATTPDPVTELTATPGNSQATLTWIAGSDGGSPILYYEFRQRSGDGPYSPWTIMVDSTGATTSYLVEGLSNGVTYWFQVRAVNAIGPTPAPPDPEPEPEEEEPETTEPEEEETDTTDPIPVVPPAGGLFYSGVITGPTFCANRSLGGPATYPHDSNGDGIADVCSLPYTRREAIARQQAASTLAATFPEQFRTLLQNSCQALANTDYGDNPADLADDICA